MQPLDIAYFAPMNRDYKSLFSLREDGHYLNCAAKAPLLRSAEAAGHEAIISRRDPSGVVAEDYYKYPDRIRELYSKLLDVSPSRLALGSSVSYGIANIMNNVVPRSQETYAVITGQEFPSDYLSLHSWAKQHGQDIKVVDENHGHETISEAVVDQISEATSLVLMSPLHWMNGTLYDLKMIGDRCRATDTILIVDGTQAVGTMPIDVHGCHIDAMLCATYKWLMGPYGMTISYMSPRFDNGQPIEESWMNRVNHRKFAELTDYSLEYLPGAARYSTGQTSHFILGPMMIKSLEQVLDWGTERIQTHCAALKSLLQAELGDHIMLPPEPTAEHLYGVAFAEHVNLERLSTEIQRRHISVSQRGSYVRISPHLYNTPDDIMALVDAVHSAA